MVSYENLSEGVIKGDEIVVEAEVNRLINEGVEAGAILKNGLIGGMRFVGKRFKDGDMFLPEILMCAKSMHKGLDIIKPLLTKSGKQVAARVVIGTVENDIHDLGKSIVGLVLEGNGYEVIDIGINLKPEVFAQAVKEHQPDILGMSALLTTTLPNIGRTIDFLKENGLRNKVKIIVGGAPVTEMFARSVGADGYASEAGSAVELVNKLIARQ